MIPYIVSYLFRSNFRRRAFARNVEFATSFKVMSGNFASFWYWLYYFIFFLGRDTNTCAYIKRRLAMCARKLGRVKEAVKLMKEVKNVTVFHVDGMLRLS
jgi:hypothetical protein